MQPHELLFKLVGIDGQVFELTRADEPSLWQQHVARALPSIGWTRITPSQALPGGTKTGALWIDESGSGDEAELADTLRTVAHRFGVTVLVRDRPDPQFSTLAASFAGLDLYVEAIADVASGNGDRTVLVMRRLSERNETARIRLTKAMSELAYTRHYFEPSEFEPLRDTVLRLQNERDALRVELDQAKTALGRSTDERDGYRERLQALATLLDEKHALLVKQERLIAQKQRQLTAHQARASELRRSFSYRFGNLFARAVRNPVDLALLPFRVVKLASKAALRLVRRRARRRSQSRTAGVQSVTAPRPAPAAAPISTRVNDKLAEMLFAFPGTAAAHASIAHPLTARLAMTVLDAAALHPNTWKAGVAGKRGIIVDSFRQLRTTAWQQTLAGSASGYAGHLVDLLEHCRAHKLPALLLLTSSPRDSISITDTLSLFSHILIPESINPMGLVSALDGRTRVIRSCWPAALPGSTESLGSRRRTSSDCLVVRDGAVHEINAAGESARRIASEFEPAPQDEVFARPLIVGGAFDEIGDLRIYELLAKGAIPVCSPDWSAPLKHYRFRAESGDLHRIARELAKDDKACVDMARSNVMAAAIHDSVEQAVLDLLAASDSDPGDLGVRQEMTALLKLHHRDDIPRVLASARRQRILPARIVVHARDMDDADALKTQLAGRIRDAVSVRCAVDFKDAWSSCARQAGENGCTIVLDSSFDYGRSYVAQAWALHASRLSSAYANDATPAFPAGLVMSGPGIAGELEPLVENGSGQLRDMAGIRLVRMDITPASRHTAGNG